MAKGIMRRLKIKFKLFFIICFSLMILFWYYLSCFCAIYENTQLHLIKETFISFSLSLLYPLGIDLMPGIFRIPSLRNQEKNKKCMYKFSKLFQFL